MVLRHAQSMLRDICKVVGQRIRQLRDERGISQEVLAGLADIDRSNISRIESGRAEPGLRTVQRIAAALGVKLTDLLSGL